MSTNSGPGYKKYPDHRITTKPAGVRVRVKLDGESSPTPGTRSGSRRATIPRLLHPAQDVKMDRLVRSKHQTVCPFKGTASYYSLKNGAENAVWTYETPYASERDRGAARFLPDKVDSIAADAE